MKRVITFLCCFLPVLLYAQQSELIMQQWEKILIPTYGYQIQQIITTTDNAYLLVGFQNDPMDVLLIKVDKDGNKLWEKTYGGSNYDIARAACKAEDGGFIIVGYTRSDDGDISYNNGDGDMWVFKINNEGIIEWEKCYGTINYEEATSIEQTYDHGYLIAGWEFNLSNNSSNMILIKIDSYGTKQWQKSYGGSGVETDPKIIKNSIGGFLIASSTDSNDGNVTNNHGYTDIWVLSIDSNGQIIWQKCFGGSDYEYNAGLSRESDGHYVVYCDSYSNDGDVSGNHGNGDLCIFRIDESGNLITQKCFGGSNLDASTRLIAFPDGSLFITSITYSVDGDVQTMHEYTAIWSILINNQNEIVWRELKDMIELQLPAPCAISNDNDIIRCIHDRHLNSFLSKFCFILPISITINDETYCKSTELIGTSGFFNYEWELNDSIIDYGNTITINEGGIYTLHAISNAGCPSSLTSIIPGPLFTPQNKDICLVTVDDSLKKNKIIIEETLQGIVNQSILVLKLNEHGITDTIAILPMSAGMYIDTLSIPEQRSYRYTIGVKDTCGNLLLGIPHTTLLLQASIGVNDEINLFWNKYEGFDYSFFEIYRSINDGTFQKIDQIANVFNSYTDLNPPSGIKKYQIRINRGSSCNLTKGITEDVKSNIIDISTLSISENKDISDKIYPNPATDKIRISGFINDRYKISDITGRILLEGVSDQSSLIDISDLSHGIYIISLPNSGKQGRFIKIQ